MSGGRPVGWALSWDWELEGDGLTCSDRKALRPWIAGQAFVDALERQPAFWEQQQRIQSAGDSLAAAWEEARVYSRRGGAKAGRRQLLQFILWTAASSPSRDAARDVLRGLPDVGCWFSDPEPDEVARAIYELRPDGPEEVETWTAAEVDADEGRVRRSRATTYRFPAPWLSRIYEGARLLAARGAGCCFDCDADAVVGDYCKEHAATTPTQREERGKEIRRREKAIERLFEDMAPAFDRAVVTWIADYVGDIDNYGPQQR